MTTSKVQSLLKQAALIYANRFGFSVFPCEPRGKKPLTQHGCKNASRDSKQIEAWWTHSPNANIGISCGQPSGYLFVLDIDGEEGRESLKQWELTYGELPNTPQVLTGKGEQYYFRARNGGLKNRVRLAPGVDCRSDNGYVIAPPSVHANGRTYLWEISGRIDEVDFSEAPEWLVKLVLGTTGEQTSSRNGDYWSNLFSKGAIKGSRNAACAQLTGYFLRRYLHAPLVADVILLWNEKRNNPPLSKKEVLQVVDSVAGIELKRRQLKWSEHA